MGPHTYYQGQNVVHDLYFRQCKRRSCGYSRIFRGKGKEASNDSRVTIYQNPILVISGALSKHLDLRSTLLYSDIKYNLKMLDLKC